MAYRVMGILQEGSDKNARWPLDDWSNAATAGEAIREVLQFYNPIPDSTQEPVAPLNFIADPSVEYVHGIWLSDGSWGGSFWWNEHQWATDGYLILRADYVIEPALLDRRPEWVARAARYLEQQPIQLYGAGHALPAPDPYWLSAIQRIGLSLWLPAEQPVPDVGVLLICYGGQDAPEVVGVTVVDGSNSGAV